MIKMSRNRISKLRCISCGCREKKVAILSDPIDTSKTVGFATTCCNCGHMQTYALKNTEETVNDADILSVLENNYKVTKITCGSHHEFCPRRKCKFWGDCKRKARPVEDQVPHSVYRPRYEQDWGPSLPPPPPAKVNCDNGRKHGDNKPCPMPDPMAPYFDAENKMRYESVKQSHKRHNKKVDAPKRKRNRFV